MLRTTFNYTHFLTEKDLITLLRTSKEMKNTLCDQLVANKHIPWQDYFLIANEDKKKYYGVRDYLLLSRIKYIITHQFNYPIIHKLTKQLSAANYLLARPQIQPTEQFVERHRGILLSDLKNELQKTLPTSLSEETQKIYRALSEKSVIVVSFDTSKVHLEEKQGQCFKNSFQLYAEGGEFKKDSKYFHDRNTTETILYSHLPTHELQLFSLHSELRPTYGSLQFYNCITPITNYGSSFVVLSEDYLKTTTLTFSDSLETTVKNRLCKPGLFTYPHSIDVQLSKQFKNACEVMALTGHFPRSFDFQYHAYQSQYIEAQLPSAIRINDSKHVRHIHCTLDDNLPALKHIEQWMCSGITVSVGNNPFQQDSYSCAYQNRTIESNLLKMSVDLIYETALILAETKPSHLTYELSPDKLRFKLKVTPNASALHQAQAAHLLYLMGARKMFDKNSPIAFRPKTNEFNYDLMLNGKSVQLGEIEDQDAYTYDFGSMAKLLNIFVKRLLTSYLVSLQNADYFEKNKKPHRMTGKGATEESNLAKELYLGDEKGSYDISTVYLNDILLIQVHTHDLRIYYRVYNYLLKIFPKCQRTDKYICISENLKTILATFKKHRFNYLATVFEEEKENPGNVLLALRKDPWDKIPLGFCTPGGHNNNPYTNQDLLLDSEFGKIKPESKPELIEESKETSTSYWLLGSQSLIERKLDANEFVPNSLHSLALYELGHLSAEQIKQIAPCFQFTEEEYKQHFGSALPLRPVDSLLIYMRTYQDSIQSRLRKEDVDCIVKIDMSVTEHNKLGKHFWLPTKGFGRIEVTFTQKSDFLAYLYTLMKNKIGSRIGFRDNTLVFFDMNPMKLSSLHAIREKDYDFLFFVPALLDSKLEPSLFDIDSELMNCTENISLAVLKKLIEKFHLNPTKLIGPGHSLAHQAASYNRLDLVTYYLKEHHCNIELRDIHGDTLLAYAITGGHKEMISLLLDNKANVNGSDSPLALAASAGDLSVLKLLITNKAEYSSQTKMDGHFALHLAVIKGHTEIITSLITEYKVDVNQLSNFRKVTPLGLAAYSGYVGVIKLLVNLKADVTATCDQYGNFPLHIAAILGHKEIMDYCLTVGKMDINKKDSKPETPLISAATFGQTHSILWLLERKASVTMKNSTNETPLLAAIANRHIESIIALYNPQIVIKHLPNDFFKDVSRSDASKLIRCMLAHVDENNMPKLLEKLKTKFKHVPLQNLYDDSEHDIIAVAKLWRRFMLSSKHPCIETLAIEKTCRAFHTFRVIEFSFCKNFPKKKFPDRLRTKFLEYFIPSYLKSRPDTIGNSMFTGEMTEHFPAPNPTPSSRRLFWENYLAELKDEKPVEKDTQVVQKKK